jgi:small GTP-binding protein
MGQPLTWFSEQEVKILVLGLDAAGKTTLLYRMQTDERTTIGALYNPVESIKINQVKFLAWDLGGQEKIWKMYREYYLPGTQGVIFLIDSHDSERIQEAREQLERLFSEESLKDAVFLILANKQDLPNALTASDLVDRMEMYNIDEERNWTIQACSVHSGEGVEEGLNWLKEQLKI